MPGTTEGRDDADAVNGSELHSIKVLISDYADVIGDNFDVEAFE